MVVSIGSRGSHIPAMTPRRKRLGVIAGMWDPLDPIETTMTLIAVNISLIYILIPGVCRHWWVCYRQWRMWSWCGVYQHSGECCSDNHHHHHKDNDKVLGQLPTKDNSPPDTNKSQPLPTRTTIPIGLFPTRTTPRGKKTLIRTNTCTVGNCPGGELSGYIMTKMLITKNSKCHF